MRAVEEFCKSRLSESVRVGVRTIKLLKQALPYIFPTFEPLLFLVP